MNKFLFSFVCLWLGLGMRAHAYEGTLVNALRGSDVQVASGSLGQISVWDQDFNISYGSDMVLEDAHINVVFRFDERARRLYAGDGKLTIKYDIELYEPGVSSPTILTNEEISIFFMRQGTYEDISIKTYKNQNRWRKARLLIRGISLQPLATDGTPSGSPTSLTQLMTPHHDDLLLELQCYTKKFFEMKTDPMPSNTLSHLVYEDGSGTLHFNPPALVVDTPANYQSCTGAVIPDNNEVTIGWLPVKGAESYDLEWIFVDFGETDMCDNASALEFDWINATRIHTTANFYVVPLLYPKGRIVYRVRAVGVELTATDIPRYGQWSRSNGSRFDKTDNDKQSFAWFGLSPSYNWTVQTSYAEEGKTKSVVAYVDGYGKNRQTMTYLSTEGLTATVEPVYDHLGRPAINALPVVYPYDGLHFTTLLNASFGKTNFDTDGHLSYVSDPLLPPATTGVPDPMSSTATEAGKFYSPNNDFVVSTPATPFEAYRQTMAEYIPQAQGYAYTQTRYSNDGSNRPHSQAGVGPNHRLGSGHETKYYYGTPTGQAEIDRFFGNEAGFVANYAKEMTVDANGQVSISYKDGAGRVVATALAGTNVNTLHHLPSAASVNTYTVSLLDDNNVNASGELVSAKDFLVSTPQTVYKLNYTADPDQYSDLCLGTHACRFEVSISVVNEDGVQMLDFNGNDTLSDEPVWVPMDPDSVFVYGDSVTLGIGKYTVIKKVRVDPAGYAGIVQAADAFLGADYQNAPCFTPIVLESPCTDCEDDCVDAFTFTYTYEGTDYLIYKPDEYNGTDYTQGGFVGLTTDTALAAAVTDNEGNPMFQLVAPSTGNFIDSLIAACQNECGEFGINPNNECNLLLTMLQNDMMPGGQYFDNGPQDPDYNPLNDEAHYSGSMYYGQPGNRNQWLVRYATGTIAGHTYPDEFTALVGITSSSWEVARTHWASIRNQPGFAPLMEEFVKLHPEYCIYKFRCENRDELPCACGGATGAAYPSAFGSLQEYETLLFNTADDSTAWALGLFAPAGTAFYNLPVGVSYPYQIYLAPWLVGAGEDSCLVDPLLDCKGGEVSQMLLNYQTITLTDNQPFPVSLYYLITDPENLHLVDTTMYTGLFPNGFIAWMIYLHGDGGSTQGLLAPFGVTPQPGQMTRFRFFKNAYMAFRMMASQAAMKPDIEACMRSRSPEHPLLDLMDAVASISCTPSASVETSYLPYLSALDADGDAVVDVDISNVACPLPDSPLHIPMTGFKIRIPYIDYSNFLNPLSTSNTGCDDLANSLSNVFIQRLLNNVNGCVKVIPPDPLLGTTQYQTVPYELTTADRTEMKEYITRIVEAACTEFQNNAGGGSINVTNFAGVDAVSSGISWAGLTWGTPYDPVTPTDYSVDGVTNLWLATVSDAEGCPDNLTGYDLFATAPPTTGDFSCTCNKITDLIHSAQALRSPFQAINPVKYQEVLGVAGGAYTIDSIFDYDTLAYFFGTFTSAAELAMIAPYTPTDFSTMSTADMKQILLHWLHACNDATETAVDSLPSGAGIAHNGILPHMFICGDDSLPQPNIPTCEEAFQEYLDALNQDAFQDFKAEQLNRLALEYGPQCLAKLKATETFTAEYKLNEYHYTLYYYDRAGNLVKTVPPEGVHEITDGSELAAVHAFRLGHSHTTGYETDTDPITGNSFVWNKHKKITVYAYNSNNQPLRQKTPDADESTFYYDFLGRIAYSVNKQQEADSEGSYTRYDAQGRIVEVGVVHKSALDASAYQSLRKMVEALPGTLGGSTVFDAQVNASIFRREITATYYDNSNFGTWGLSAPVSQQNLRSRVSTSAYYEQVPGNWKLYDNAVHYSYDLHGNVKDLLQDVPALAEFDRRYLLTNYEYDLISGKVNALHYMKGQKETFSHYYTYDSDNRLTRVYTSSNDGFTKELEAKYYYHLTGALARTELGRHQVQGLDYTYTLHGWLKGVNGDYLNAKHDRGRDGYNLDGDQLHGNFGVDGMGFTLGYYSKDYEAIGSSHYRSFELALQSLDAPLSHFLPATAFPYGLYNGNILKMVSNTLDCDESPLDAMGRFYTYDQLNRIRSAKHLFIDNTGYLDNDVTASWASGIIDNGWYDTWINEYDADGNIKKLKRHGNDPGNLVMDDLVYDYIDPENNRLDRVNDLTGATAYSNDFNPGQSGGNYVYDLIGNLVEDKQNDSSKIDWNVYGKVKAVDFATRKDLGFYYSPMGQRIIKTEGTTDNGDLKMTVYALDAQGNVLAIYEAAGPTASGTRRGLQLNCKERMIYGSGRLGMLTLPVTIKSGVSTFSMGHLKASAGTGSTASGVSVLPQPLLGPMQPYPVYSGFRLYELSNHLGNVLATVSDRKVWKDQDIVGNELFRYRPDIMMYTEYYPFGSPLPGWECHEEEPQFISETKQEILHQSDFDSYSVGYAVPPNTDVSGWTVWGSSPSNTSVQTQSGSDRWLQVNSSHCAHGTHQYFNTVAGTTYTLNFDVDLGSANKVNLLIWDVTPGGTLYNLRLVTYTADADNVTQTFVAGDTRVLVQFRQDDCGVTRTFYMDDAALWNTVTNVTGLLPMGGYRYGFNGQEKDNEIYGEGNAYTAEFWEYDSRIGRRWNMDPKRSSSWSPYSCFMDNPVFYNDIKGDTVGGDMVAYGAYKDEISNRISRLDAKINRQNSKLLDRMLQEKSTTGLERRIAKNNATRDMYYGIQDELTALETSNQVYNIVTGVSTNAGGFLNYDKSTDFVNVNISIGSTNPMATLAHELKHAYQYETKKIALDYDGKGGTVIYDIHDEVEAYQRGQLFGSPSSGIIVDAAWVMSLTKENGQKAYNIPVGPLDASSVDPFSGNSLGYDIQQNLIQRGSRGSGPRVVMLGWQFWHNLGKAMGPREVVPNLNYGGVEFDTNQNLGSHWMK